MLQVINWTQLNWIIRIYLYVQHEISFLEISLSVRGMFFENLELLRELNLVTTCDFEKDQFPIQIWAKLSNLLIRNS